MDNSHDLWNITEGIYGVAESDRYMKNENAKGILANMVALLRKNIIEHDKKIREDEREKFSEWILYFVDGYYFKSKEDILEAYEQYLKDDK